MVSNVDKAKQQLWCFVLELIPVLEHSQYNHQRIDDNPQQKRWENKVKLKKLVLWGVSINLWVIEDYFMVLVHLKSLEKLKDHISLDRLLGDEKDSEIA